MVTMELTVFVSNRQVRVSLPDGGEATERISPSSLQLRTVGLFKKWLARNDISEREELIVLGLHLYDVLFTGEVRQFFERALTRVSEGQLRVRLGFAEDAQDLASLPWEYLYYPGGEGRQGFYFATRHQLVLSRYLQLGNTTPPYHPEEGPLRILLIVSQPRTTDLEPISAEPIRDALQSLQQRKLVTVDELTDLQTDTFLDTLAGYSPRPHVLHFVSHGGYREGERKAVIALPGPDGELIWYGDYELAEVFVQMNWAPRLVFFYFGNRDTQELKESFVGLERQLLLAKVQAVVAMQYPIIDQAVRTFCRTFYEKLAVGEQIADAVQQGRARIGVSVPRAYESRVYGTPVMYTASGGAIINPVPDVQGVPR